MCHCHVPSPDICPLSLAICHDFQTCKLSLHSWNTEIFPLALMAKVSQTEPRGSALKGVMVKMLAARTIRIHLEEVLQPPAVWPRLTTYKVIENKQEWAAAAADKGREHVDRHHGCLHYKIISSTESYNCTKKEINKRLNNCCSNIAVSHLTAVNTVLL